jgi:branched-chain amino acid transport system ATP-binding protein
VDHMLDIRGVSKSFGGLSALRKIEMHVKAGEVVGLIGPNGSGKTTLFNVLSGFYAPDEGQILFEGRRLDHKAPHVIARRGLGRTFQIVRPLIDLTVADNLIAGPLYTQNLGMRAAREQACTLLEFVGLAPQASTPARDLTLVEKKRLEIGRALSTRPRLLLLDEVFAGLNPSEVKAAVELIRRIRHELKITILMIEHVMKVTMETCDRVVVLSYGEKIAEGTPAEIVQVPAVLQVYLGVAHA